MKIPYAKAYPLSYEIVCPNCSDIIPAPNGSLFWTKEEMQLRGRDHICDNCHLALKIPKPRGR